MAQIETFKPIKLKKITIQYHRLFRIALLFFFVYLPSLIYAQQYAEIEIKAAQLVIFPKFVEGEAFEKAINKEFNIGIYNAPPEVFDIVGRISSSEYKNSPPIIDNISSVDDLERTLKDNKIRVLFIYKVDGGIVELRKILDVANGKKGILVVGNEIKYFCENGGMLNFSPPDMEAKRYQINIEEAKKAGLQFKTQLRSLAGEPIETRR